MRAVVFVSALILTGACASVAPRFDQPVAASFARDDMRVLTTADAEVHYAAPYKDTAVRVAARAGECLHALRALQKNPWKHGRALLFVTSANFNNAYVTGFGSGEPMHSVLPTGTTVELLNWYGFAGAEVGDIACHEMFHYAHLEQVAGFWGVINDVFGQQMPVQVALESWFTEGAAQYYEGRIARARGRPNAPLYRGAFESFVAKKGKVEPGDLNVGQRELYPFSGAYLTSLPFIEWLAATYGEEKLWQLMQKQGTDFFVFFGVTIRFADVYHRDLGDLISEWNLTLAKAPKREKPAEQRTVFKELGQLARLASHAPSGRMAVITEGNEEPATLRIVTPDGNVKFERRLTRLDPGREWVNIGPDSISGLSFNADGSALYLVNEDVTSLGDTRAQLWRIEVYTGEISVVHDRLGTMSGGALHPSGQRYTLVETTNGSQRFVDLDLASGKQTVLSAFEAGVGVAAPTWSPNGERFVFSRLDRAGWNLVLRLGDGSLQQLTFDGAFNYGAHFTDDTHVIFVRSVDGHTQAHRLDLSTGALEQLSKAPFAVVDAAANRDELVFINREGTHWTLDATPIHVQATTLITRSSTSEVPFEQPAVAVERDEPYSPGLGLLVPQLRTPNVPTFFTSGSNFSALLGLTLLGRDKLAWHTWAVSVDLLVPTLRTQVSLEYRLARFAPWELGVTASRGDLFDSAFWSGQLFARRTFWTMPVTFGVRGIVRQPLDAAGKPIDVVADRFIGPSFSASWSAGDRTAYGGVNRWLGVSVSMAGYPRVFGSSFDMADLGGALQVSVPLPLEFFKRDRLLVGVVGRGLAGAPNGALMVGGDPRTSYLFNPGTSSEKAPTQYAPGALSEYVRGYEDVGVRATAAAIASASYRHSFIIDRGFASLLFIFPSIFFRQVDVEVFGTAAYTDSTVRPWSRALGASAMVRMMVMGQIPVSVGYQFAGRFDGSLKPLHMLAVGLE